MNRYILIYTFIPFKGNEIIEFFKDFNVYYFQFFPGFTVKDFKSPFGGDRNKFVNVTHLNRKGGGVHYEMNKRKFQEVYIFYFLFVFLNNGFLHKATWMSADELTGLNAFVLSLAPG